MKKRDYCLFFHRAGLPEAEFSQSSPIKRDAANGGMRVEPVAQTMLHHSHPSWPIHTYRSIECSSSS